ncbi:MAG: hypothetical protein AAF519_16980, partial [Bacteroidota bacterium]
YRIKSISYYESGLHKPLRKKTYSYADPNQVDRSSGVVDGKLGQLENTYSIESSDFLWTQGQNGGTSDLGVVDISWQVTHEGVRAELLRGGYVSYARVREKESGNGFTDYLYTSPKDYPSLSGTTGYPFIPSENRSYKLGLLTMKRVYDQASKIVSETENRYEFMVDIVATYLKIVDSGICEWKRFYDSYSQYVNRSPEGDRLPIDNNGDPRSFAAPSNCGTSYPVHVTGGVTNANDLRAGWAKLTYSRQTEFNYENNLTSSFSTKNYYVYNPMNFQLKEKRNSITRGGIAVDYYTSYYYPNDDITIPANQQLIDLNRVNELVMVEECILQASNDLNCKPLNVTKYKYDSFPDGLVEIKEIYQAVGDNNLIKEQTYLKYNRLGMPTWLSRRGDQHITYLWGYNNLLPVAKIINAAYPDVVGLINQGILDQLSHNAGELQAELDKLRQAGSLIDAEITTYSHKVGIGITSKQDANGLNTRYDYDGYGRLINSWDNDENLLRHIEYQLQN